METPVIEFEYNHSSVKDKAILGLEAELGISLPSDYRGFLEAKNGGRPHEYEIEVSGWGTTVIQSLLGVGAPGRADLAFQTRRMAHLLPPGVIPIGSDPGGNYFCIAAAPLHAGVILLWDHESSTPDEDEGETEFKMYAVAPSFSSFLKALRRLSP